MADIFISYKAERRRAARHLSKVIGAHGFSVWFDYGLLPGDDFEPRLMSELGAANAVVVLWCEMSVKSEWVKKEARVARTQGKFLPCWIESAKLPDEFAGADTINLSGWDASPRSHMLDRLIDDISRRVGREPTVNYRELRDLEDDWRGFGEPSLAQFALSDAPKPLAEAPLPTQPQPAGAQRSIGAPPPGISANLAETWKRAQAGDAAALVTIGYNFDYGLGDLAKDQHEAVRFYRLAADRGNATGQANLGAMYRSGLGGVVKDEHEAVRLYKLSAAQANATGLVNLGDAYRRGVGGLGKDEREAARLFKLAADQGNARAQTYLGDMYRDGIGGLTKDGQEAARLYKLAALQGNERAQAELKRLGET